MAVYREALQRPLRAFREMEHLLSAHPQPAVQDRHSQRGLRQLDWRHHTSLLHPPILAAAHQHSVLHGRLRRVSRRSVLVFPRTARGKHRLRGALLYAQQREAAARTHSGDSIGDFLHRSWLRIVQSGRRSKDCHTRAGWLPRHDGRVVFQHRRAVPQI